MPAKGQDIRMQRSQAIARVVGPVFAAIGTGMLASGPVYRDMAQQFVSGYPFIYFSGVLLLVAGLTILNAHHAWTPDWRSAITALGWIFTGIGSFRVIAPNFVSFVGGALMTSNGFFTACGIVFLAIGGFFTFKGYVGTVASEMKS
jgi:hypothetical protein